MAKLTRGMIVLDCQQCGEQFEATTMANADYMAREHCRNNGCLITEIYGSQCYGWES